MSLWDCKFVQSDVALGTTYSVLSVVSVAQLYNLYVRSAVVNAPDTKSIQKIFSLLITLCVALRSVSFFGHIAWMPNGADCTRPTIGNPNVALDILGTMPAALFFSAFCALVFKARRLF